MAIRTDPHRTTAKRRERPPVDPYGSVVGSPNPAVAVPSRSAPSGHATGPSLEGRPDPDRPARQVGPAGRVLVIGLACFLMWGVLAAPSLRRSAESSPLGIRRTVALSVLGPFARVSGLLGLDRVDSAADRALGRADEGQRIPPVDSIGPRTPSIPPSARSRSPARSTSSPVSSDPGVRPPASVPPSLSLPVNPAVRLHRPTKAHPLRVLAVGDSIGQDLAIGLGRALSGKKSYSLETDTREATGLARPDYFNWAYQVARDVRQFRPNVVVAAFGANDGQSFLVGGRAVSFGSSEWKRIYRRRVGRIMAELSTSGRPVIWVGMPPMASDRLSRNMRMIDALFRAEASRHPGVIYLDSWSLFTTSDGGYSAYLPSSSGQEQLMRTSDGIHLTAAGLDRLGDEVLRVMAMLWKPPR